MCRKRGKKLNLSKENIKKILFIISFALILFFLLYHFSSVLSAAETVLAVLSPFLLGFCLAFVINVLLRPLEKLWDRIGKKKKGKILSKLKRPFCLAFSALIMAGVIFIIFFMVVPELKKTIGNIIELFPQYMERLEASFAELAESLAKRGIVLPELSVDFNKFMEAAGDFLSSQGEAFINKTVDITTSIFTWIFNIALGLVFAFYLLYQKETISRQLKRLLEAFLPPSKIKSLTELAELSNRTFTNFITGQLTEAVIIGALCFIGMCVFSMPYAPVVSVLVAFTALIPVFGAFLGTAVGAFLILMVDPLKALWFILFIIVLQQLEGDIIYPKVVGKSVGLPGIWVLAAVTVGGSLFGIIGMLLSVPVCSVLYSVCRQMVAGRIEKKATGKKRETAVGKDSK